MEHPDYLAMAKQINQIDIYKQAAAARQGQRAHQPDAQQQAGWRGVGRQAPKYADSFKIKRDHSPGLEPKPTTQRSAMVSAVFTTRLSEPKVPDSMIARGEQFANRAKVQ
jgi:hypothetical protein